MSLHDSPLSDGAAKYLALEALATVARAPVYAADLVLRAGGDQLPFGPKT